MRKSSSFVLSVCLFAAAVSVRAQQQNPRYVYNGKILQMMDEDVALAKYRQWQVWLYHEGVRIPRYTAGLQYSRWGLIEQNSPESVMKRLKGCQSFKKAYLSSSGPVRGGGIPSSIQSALSE